MSDKSARKFQKLLDAHREAVEARKSAAKAARAVRGLDGDAYSLSALASKAGAKALAAEIEALREERRTLKRLAAFATRHVNEHAGSDKVETVGEDKARKVAKTARKGKESASA